MRKISEKLYLSAVDGHVHWCPGCECYHRIPDTWQFNGDINRPTFSPSVKHLFSRRSRCCHYFLRDGDLVFCSDSTHHLAGKTVPLPDMPGDAEEEKWDEL